jgi:hypothetical protein
MRRKKLVELIVMWCHISRKISHSFTHTHTRSRPSTLDSLAKVGINIIERGEEEDAEDDEKSYKRRAKKESHKKKPICTYRVNIFYNKKKRRTIEDK